MITSYNIMEALETRDGWRYFSFGEPDKYRVMVKPDTPTGLQALILCNPLVYDNSSCQQEDWEILMHRHFGDRVSSDNMLFIYLGGTNVRITGNNKIIIDSCSSRIKANVDERFKSTVTVIRSLVGDITNADIIKEYSSPYYRSGALAGNTAAVWLLLLSVALVYAFLGAAPASLGISAESVLSESYRLITYMFTHANLSHILGNCLSLAVIGISLVRKKGSAVVLSTFFLGGIFAGVVTAAYKYYTGSSVMTFGASGAIFALYGALLVAQIQEGFDKRSLIITSLVILAINSIGANVDYAAHIGGFFGGMLFGAWTSSIQAYLDTIKAEKSANKMMTEKKVYRTPSIALQAIDQYDLRW